MINLRIKEILKSKNITQVELARHLGVTSVTVNGWVTGRRLPSLEILDKIACYTSTPIIRFFTLTAKSGHDGSAPSDRQQPIAPLLRTQGIKNKR